MYPNPFDRKHSTIRQVLDRFLSADLNNNRRNRHHQDICRTSSSSTTSSSSSASSGKGGIRAESRLFWKK